MLQTQKPKKKAAPSASSVAIGEPWLALLRRLQLQCEGSLDGKAIGFTGAKPKQGVTTTAANLALAAAQSGATVALVDANNCQPKLASLADIPNNSGLLNALRGDVPAFDCVFDSPFAGLSIVPYGQLPNGQRPLFEAREIDAFFDQLRQGFSLIVVDLPVANEYTICLPMAARLDKLIAVVRPGRIKQAEATHMRELLRRTDIQLSGIVCNKPSASAF